MGTDTIPGPGPRERGHPSTQEYAARLRGAVTHAEYAAGRPPLIGYGPVTVPVNQAALVTLACAAAYVLDWLKGREVDL